MSAGWWPIVAGIALMAGVVVGDKLAPAPAPIPPPLRAAHVSKAQRAFCNCLKTRAYLQECLAGAEQGDGRGVNDQELLLSRCLDGDHVPVLPEPRGTDGE